MRGRVQCYTWMGLGWSDGMVIIGRRSSRSNFGAENDDYEDNFFPSFPMLQDGGFPIYPGGFIPGFNHLNPYRDPNDSFGSFYGLGSQSTYLGFCSVQVRCLFLQTRFQAGY